MTPTHPTLRSLGLTPEECEIVVRRFAAEPGLERRAIAGKVSDLRKIATRVLREAKSNEALTGDANVTVTAQDLKSKTLPELVEIYNSRAGKPVKGFKDKPTALRRVRHLLGVRGPGRQPTLIDLKPKAQSSQIEPREKSMRGRIAVMLRGSGATLQEINDEIGGGKWTTRHTKAHVLLLNEVNGFGLEQNETSGKIRIVR